MASLISTTTPLGTTSPSNTFTSTVETLSRATQITGTVFADQAGVLTIQQSGDGVNWDIETDYNIPASTGVGVEVDVIAQYFQVTYVNGSIAQSVFRLFVDFRDPYGDFLIAADVPTDGGQWAVLRQEPNGAYSWVGRFDATDGWNANGNAAIYLNKSAVYASFPVTTATVSSEIIQLTSEHSPASF